MVEKGEGEVGSLVIFDCVLIVFLGLLCIFFIESLQVCGLPACLPACAKLLRRALCLPQKNAQVLRGWEKTRWTFKHTRSLA
jgi:hypothetical protein